MPLDIKSLTRDELLAWFDDAGQPAYRVDQLLHWIHVQRVTDWDAMSNLPKPLRDQLREPFALRSLDLVRQQGSPDDTQKFLWRLDDGSLIESVLIPASAALYGEPSDRHTLCVSTQVGCAYGCRFCASGLLGWKRNLGAEEIIEQVLALERRHSEANPATGPGPASRLRLVDNLVVMGMGEPLANLENLLRALTVLNAPWGGGIGARKITVSTSGLVPQIRRLADEPIPVRLAVSLHGATDEVRERIMPINRRYPLAELAAGCEYYQEKKGRMITLEYILIAGVNDGLDQVKPLAQLARRLHAKVNLIPYNPVEGLAWNRPSERDQERFLRALERWNIPVTLRREKGGDIDAACGQLRLKTERDLGSKAQPQTDETRGGRGSARRGGALGARRPRR